MTAGSFPVVDQSVDEIVQPELTVWGTLLAAGTSSRYGDRNKLLVDIDGEPMVRHATGVLSESSVDGVTIIVGHEADRVRTAVGDLNVEIRENNDYERGQSTSVRAATLAARKHNADAVVVALGDMPYLSSSTIDRLIAAYATGSGDALAAAYEGRRGNPVLFDARFFDDLLALEGDIGGREILLHSDAAALVETGDPGVVRDVDILTDMEKTNGT
ncbi:nucleotidyltransferase family protein [Haladaptatus sp. DFWS20]|uniref:nucleotidyltransferase family protein n=1 Tax=Haladaptatus sp. DFWS20 TaxID=3403467 RepID=UPI003EBFEB68